MKRLISLLLVILLLFSMAGCGSDSGSRGSVEFYYPWADLEAAMKQDPKCSAIGSELRDIAGREDDLTYVLSLYLRGPLNPELKTPVPSGCRLVAAAVEQDTLCITLDSAFTTLENTQLTLACACLAKTGFSLADVTQVQITAASSDGSKSIDITINADSLLLTDLSGQSATEESQ